MPTQTLQQFGQTIKAKHPEYADLSDEAVGQKVLDKYPQYRDMVSNAPLPRPAGLPAGMDLPGAPTPKPMVDMNNAPASAQHASTLVNAGQVVREGAKGVVKGAANTASNLLGAANLYEVPQGSRLSGALNNTVDKMQQFSQPENTPQAVGRGLEQVGEFFVPGAGEEDAAADLAPSLGRILPSRIAAPAARVATGAFGAGAVNSAQGGSFGTGAATGALGAGVGQAVGAIAPRIAESALNIRKLDRAYGKGGGTIGRAILDETTGLSPASVAESAQGKLNVLNPQLNEMADAASARPNNVRGLLSAPAEEIPLHSAPDVAGTPSQPITLNQIDRPMPPGLPTPSENVPLSSHAGIFPDQLPSAFSSVRPSIDAGSASGMGPGQYIGQIAGERGGPGLSQGVLLRRAEAEPFQIPPSIPNPTASLGPARGVLSSAIGKATTQGERTTLNQLSPLVTHLGETVDGNSIPENVTPRQLLDLKRGFGNEFIHHWNPETMQGVKGTAAQTYHALGQSFNDAVPGAQDLNSRISTLIPVAKRAESLELNAPTTQRLFQRIAAPTGALTGAVGGGYAGYEHDGAAGAAEGAGVGLLAPLLLTTPTGQMALARTFNGLAKPAAKALVGAGLQASDRSKTAVAKTPK